MSLSILSSGRISRCGKKYMKNSEIMSRETKSFLDAPEIGPVRDFMESAFREVARVRLSSLTIVVCAYLNSPCFLVHVCREVLLQPRLLFSMVIFLLSCVNGMTQRCFGEYIYAWPILLYKFLTGIEKDPLH